ncbi:MAG TPA: YjjG family noncanonical pyrimidine nucleotidase [Williamwhitmania sp.]|nr:YjjG family noncanonical pyrimidine nucleotidase [Williamwhitmania sp.]
MITKFINRLNIKHIFFDLDRTLWDFETNSNQTLKEVFQLQIASQTDVSAEEFTRIYHKHNNRLWSEYRKGAIKKEVLRWKRFHLTLNEIGIKNETLAQQVDEEYIFQSPLKTNLLPFTLDTLQYLKGRYSLHIITNGFSEVQFVKINRSGLEPFFSHVVTSEEAGFQKPAPQVFNYALAKAGATIKQSIMVGDDLETDILGARSIGMKQVFFNPTKLAHNQPTTWEIAELRELVKLF